MKLVLYAVLAAILLTPTVSFAKHRKHGGGGHHGGGHKGGQSTQTGGK